MKWLRLMLATVLGVAAALLVACGSSSKLIPPGNAGPLQNDFDAVASAVNSGDCTAANDALSRAQSDVGQLPSSVDPLLVRNIEQGLRLLEQRTRAQCRQQTQSTPTNTNTTPTNTNTNTTPTNTTPKTTPTTTPTNTNTTPTPKTTPSTTPTGPVPDNGGGTPAPTTTPKTGNGSGGAAPSGVIGGIGQ
jgi:hypothetical protein